MKSKLLLFSLSVIILTITLFVIGFIPAGAEAQKEIYDLTLAGTVAVTDPEHFALQRFVDLVHKKTDGQIKISYFPGGQLGSTRECWEAIRIGTLDMYVSGDSVFATYYTPVAVISMPYMWDDLDHLHRFYNSPVGHELFEDARKATGIRMICELDRGPRQITNSVRPIYSIEDVKGLKIRVPEDPVLIEVFKAFGAKPTPVDWKEIYTSLSQGLVDGQDNGVDTVYGAKLQEVQKYFALTEHIICGYGIYMNDKKFQMLPKEFQDVLLEAGKEAVKYRRELLDETESKNLQEMVEKNGMVVTRPDKSGFKEATKDIWEKFVEKFGAEFEEYYLKVKAGGDFKDYPAYE